MSDQDYQDQGPVAFDDKEMRSLVDKVVEPVLAHEVYDPAKVQGWTSRIVEELLKSLATANKPFKYVITCVLMQKSGTELTVSSTSYWEAASDTACTVRWDSATTNAVITVFALRL